MSALLFIHGFATPPQIWENQIHEFSRDFEVFTDPSRIDRYQDIFLVGWSMGGWKALDLWQENQKRIKGIVLVSAFAKYVQSDDYPCGTPLALLRKLEKRFLKDYKTGIIYFYDLIFEDQKRHYLIEKLPAPDEAKIRWWFDKLRNEDKRSVLGQINVPVLIIQGDSDKIVSPASALYLKERIKNCEVHILPNVGHAPFFEEKEKFNLILREFVRKHKNG
jgi:pimeloyl-[acyl-carrier protein] methyl ester esterase